MYFAGQVGPLIRQANQEGDMNKHLDNSSAPLVARELAYRSHDGVAVTLLWWPGDDHLTVTVVEDETGSGFEIPVGRRRPLDVFYHPYAYAPLAVAA
jgi:hypothetical protein